MHRILILNGPNLDLLGQREPEIYGADTLEDLEGQWVTWGQEHGVEITCEQSNHEGDLIEFIHHARGVHGGLVFNPGGYTHTSVALRDALLGVRPLPFIEVHLSQPAARESFRHQSLMSDIALGTISGLGPMGYTLALQAMCRHLDGLTGGSP
ncbi:MAG: type II 3-dehydroquinate dehydratase [Bradymonadia bacterium]